MSRNPLGWAYPAGAEHDRHSPWNAVDAPECPQCGSTDADMDEYLSDEISEEWQCHSCGRAWSIQIGRDPDEARDEARDEQMEMEWERDHGR